MANGTDRREFLRQVSIGALGLAGGVVGQRAAPAVSPIGRTHRSQIKLSLAAYSFRQYLTAKESPMTLFDFIDLCADLRLDGTELTSYYFPKEPTSDYFAQIKRRAFLRGLDISGTAIANDFCLPPGEKRNAQIAHVKKWVDYAAQFGAGTIRVYSGSVPKGRTLEEAQAWCVECFEQTCAYAGERGIFLALENHGGISVTADLLLALLDKVKSPWFGINLDTGNFRTKDPYGEMARVAPYAVNVQCKTEVQPEGGRKEPMDYGRVVGILREVKYSGYVALEYEAAEDPKTGVPNAIEQLRAAIAKA